MKAIEGRATRYVIWNIITHYKAGSQSGCVCGNRRTEKWAKDEPNPAENPPDVASDREESPKIATQPTGEN